MTPKRLNGLPDRRYGPRGPQPHLWSTGPDPVRHQIYRWWLVHRAQAHHRAEAYALTFDQFESWWRHQDRYLRRGRRRGSVIMVRRDPQQPWSEANLELRPRDRFYTHRRGRPR